MMKKKTTYSLPSLRERSETPEALDGRDWESREANPLPRTVLSASVRITGYRRSDCRRGRQESISSVYGAAQTPTRLLGRQMFRTPVCKRTRHLDFPPKPCSNLILKPQPAEVSGVRQWIYRLQTIIMMLTTMI